MTLKIDKPKFKSNEDRGGGGGLVVSVLAFYLTISFWILPCNWTYFAQCIQLAKCTIQWNALVPAMNLYKLKRFKKHNDDAVPKVARKINTDTKERVWT